MIPVIQKFVRAADAAVARAYLALRREQNALMPFLFHSLFRNEREMALNVVEPLNSSNTISSTAIVSSAPPISSPGWPPMANMP